MKTGTLLLFLALSLVSTVSSFTPKNLSFPSATATLSKPSATASSRRHMTDVQKESASAFTVDPAKRDAQYGKNVAQYLVDLHDAKATFDFCGGMLFQLVLTDKLRDHLVAVTSQDDSKQPVVFDAGKPRMQMIPNYSKTAHADNRQIFHGREIRQVPTAAGSMGMVLQLSLADESNTDPEGWTSAEVQGYDGWGHDSGRVWRKGPRLEEEGFKTFRERFGPDAFALHHRFYLHLDGRNRLWLSAEDGCEGTPAASEGNAFSRFFGR
jgi:hypothetical protein